jgi:hypothetical protein
VLLTALTHLIVKVTLEGAIQAHRKIRSLTVNFIEPHVYSFKKANIECVAVAQSVESLIFPVVSLEFFINLIVIPESTRHLTEMGSRNMSSGVKAAGAYG